MAKQTFTTGQVLTAAQMTSLQQTAMGGGSTTAKVASYVLVAADAGTVVQMNAAGATTITVNTALFAAGDTVQIQNIGAGVCTVTAGTATVSTSATLALKQYDAGSLYFNTTSAAIFFAVDAADGMTNPMTTTGDMVYSSSGSTPARLGIGTTGQVVTVAAGIPSWATPAAAASGLTLINSTTFSGAGNVAVDSVFTSTYANYFIQTNFTAVGSLNQTLGLRMRAGGVDDTGGNYINQGIRAYPSAVIYTGGVLTSFALQSLSSANPAYGHHSVQLLAPNAADFSKIDSLAFGYDATYSYNTVHMSGLLATSTAYDGFKLFVASGNIAGTVKTYGYQN